MPRLALIPACVLALSACGGLHGADTATGPAAPPATGHPLASPQADGRTAEGGYIDGFQFAEKPGDVSLNPVAFSGGTARASGVIDPRHGSTWGGIALTTSLARGGRAVDMGSARAISLWLASPVAATLRVRLVGRDVALRDSGCYPVAVVQAGPQLKEYTLPIASFFPEAFCGTGAPSGPAVSTALTAVEIADATVIPGRARTVDFTVGAIRALP